MHKECEHFLQKKENISPNTIKCEECEKEHLPTVALRMCLTCGHVGCCDSSIGKHATKHFKDTSLFLYIYYIIIKHYTFYNIHLHSPLPIRFNSSSKISMAHSSVT